MIEINNLVDDLNGHIGILCGENKDATDLARIVDVAVSRDVKICSMLPRDVATVWPWLEGRNIKIFARFYLERGDTNFSDLIADINRSFRNGADGAQIFLSFKDLAIFIRNMQNIRDDLFFNKHLSVGLDIAEVGPFDWGQVFDSLTALRADSLVLALLKDDGKKSDFVGRVYAALSAWNYAYSGDLHWMTGTNVERIEQASRLMVEVQPKLWTNACFFVQE